MQAPPTDGPFFIVMNVGSGRQDEQRRRDLIVQAMALGGRQHQLFTADREHPVADAARQAVDAARARHGVVVAAGGDGTINAVAQAVLGSGCAFGVLPQGTFNYFGRTHAIPEQTEEALALLLTGQPVPVQVGCINDRVFLVNASVGLYPQLLEDREGYKNRFGRSRPVALLSAVVSLLNGHRQLRLDVDWSAAGPSTDAAQGRQTLRTPTLFVGNNRLQLEQIGIDEAGAVEQGRLVALAPRAVGTATLFWLALRGAMGSLGEAGTVRRLAFRTLRVRPASRFGRGRFKIATDGEIGWMAPPLDFAVHPQPLWLIKAPPAAGADRR